MFAKYSPRNHTKKQNNNCKPSLSAIEKQFRKRKKQFAKKFPKLFLLGSIAATCKQHSLKDKNISVTIYRSRA